MLKKIKCRYCLNEIDWHHTVLKVDGKVYHKECLDLHPFKYQVFLRDEYLGECDNQDFLSGVEVLEEARKNTTLEDKVKDYIESYVIDGLSFESARDFLECCHLYFNDEDENRKYLIDAHLSNYSQERLKECSAIYDWYHENSTEFIRMWLEVAECE